MWFLLFIFLHLLSSSFLHLLCLDLPGLPSYTSLGTSSSSWSKQKRVKERRESNYQYHTFQLHCRRVEYLMFFNCLSLFLVLIGQKSITWQKVFCATTGDDVRRSLFNWADRSLFTRARPIYSVLQVSLTRAESASAHAQLQLHVSWAELSWANGQQSWAFNSRKSRGKKCRRICKITLIRITR